MEKVENHPEQEELPIAEHGVIGNMTIFLSLLDKDKGGFFKIAPVRDNFTSKQFYWPDTNILVSRFLSDEGVAQVIDFMPVKGTMNHWRNGIVRIVEGIRGDLEIRMQCFPAFDYARQPHSIRFLRVKNHKEPLIMFQSAQLTMVLMITLQAGCETLILSQRDAGVEGVLAIKESQRIIFEFCECTSATHLSPIETAVALDLASPQACPEHAESPTMDSRLPADEAVDIFLSHMRSHSLHEIFKNNVRYWKNWLNQCTYDGLWQEKVHRSALVLKLLTYENSGAILAALTFGLPEELGGERNWDYRYTWIRDASFTLYALLRIGFADEAGRFMNFIEERIRSTHPGSDRGPLQIMYGIEGEKELKEKALLHLRGYAGSSPVWIGNWAWQHLQLDVYGELMDSVYLANKWGTPISLDLWFSLTKLVDWVCENWTRLDLSIWEPPLDRLGLEGMHFVYSKVMCWVALDRAIRLADKRSLPAPRRDAWTQIRDEIYLEIQRKGWDDNLKAFTLAYGNESLDASHLIMPLVFFMAPNDPRMAATIDAISRPTKFGGLVSGGLVYRYQRASFDDGLKGEEGTFNMCTFWLIEALARSGGAKLEEARLLFDQMLTFSNHVGLYSEETSHTGLMLGNFPQALTHLALISTAFNLDRALKSSKSQPASTPPF